MSSPIGQEAAFGVYQNSGRFNVKFSTFGDWYYVSTVNKLPVSDMNVVHNGIYCRYLKTYITFAKVLK